MKSAFGLLVLSVLLSAPGASAQEVDTRHYIYVEANAAISAPADFASVTVRISHKGDTPDEAVDASAQAMDALLAALVEVGVPRSKIATSNFVFKTAYIRPESVSSYEPDDPDRDTFDGYRVSSALDVTIEDLATLGEVLTRIARLGASISEVSFHSSKASAYYDQAREKAAADALRKAQLFAKSTDVTLGPLLSMREGSGYNSDAMEVTPVDGEADLMTPTLDIAPGMLIFSANVSGKWEVTENPGE